MTQRMIRLTRIEAGRALQRAELDIRAASVSTWDESAKLGPDECIGVWSDNPMLMASPTALLVEGEHLRDWLAWLAAYVPGVQPVTSYCRIIARDTYRAACRAVAVTESHRQVNHAALAGIVLGEILAMSPDAQEVSALHGSAFLSTFSFVAIRDALLYRSFADPLQMSHRFQHARRLTSQPERAIPLQTVIAAVYSLCGVPSPDSRSGIELQITAACDQLRNDGRIRELESLGEVGKALARINNELDASRDVRVKAIETLASFFAESGARLSPLDAFMMGYAASRIAPGSLAHWGLVREFFRNEPGVVVWYSVCAALSDRTLFLAEFGGAGRRIARDLFFDQSPLEPPRCDISVDELEVILAGAKQPPKFMRHVASQATVELRPGVHTVVSWGRVSLAEETARKHSVSHALPPGVEIQQLLDRVKDLVRPLLERSYPQGEQATLFDEGRKKKKR